MDNLKELFGVGASIAFGLFFLVYYIRIMSADNPAEAVDIFAKTIVVFIFVLVPTSPIGAIVSVSAGAIGAAISLDSMQPKFHAMVATFGFCYTLTNIVINWFTVPA